MLQDDGFEFLSTNIRFLTGEEETLLHNRNVVLEEEKSSAIASKLKDRIKTIIDRKSTQRKINRKPTIGIHD